ncbi:MAG: ribosomal protein large subunit ribosomal protein [Parcubacteria group bacterium]|nr:ribosomal protein large subunit ribosomal protein [Parcubacteria group bacterium]
MLISKEKQASAFDALKGQFGYANVFASPKLVKVTVSSGVGKADKARKALVESRLARITGQKASARPAKQSIAQFKMREGDIVGFQVTLRGNRMNDFVDKLIHIALPRTRDFRGLTATAIDEMGNLTIGIKDHTIFPETTDEDLKDVFGIAITLVTTAKNKVEAEAFFRHLGIPFKNETEA